MINQYSHGQQSVVKLLEGWCESCKEWRELNADLTSHADGEGVECGPVGNVRLREPNAEAAFYVQERMRNSVVVDFDGTICNHEFPDIGAPKPGVKEALLQLSQMGLRVVIHTVRTARYWAGQGEAPEVDLERVKQYLKRHGLLYDEIWMQDKPLAVAYIDDRAVKYAGDWAAVVKEVERMKDGG